MPSVSLSVLCWSCTVLNSAGTEDVEPEVVVVDPELELVVLELVVAEPVVAEPVVVVDPEVEVELVVVEVELVPMVVVDPEGDVAEPVVVVGLVVDDDPVDDEADPVDDEADPVVAVAEVAGQDAIGTARCPTMFPGPL